MTDTEKEKIRFLRLEGCSYAAVPALARQESEVFMDIRVQDILVMKKAHPCGDKRWAVLRTGMDFRLRCLGCGHEVMLPRSKAEKNIRQVLRDGAPI